ncbi:MAG: threonine synthase [Sphingomonadaceae bacterium]|nr:threonine synthase [Sphingomonadaceae bacterium]
MLIDAATAPIETFLTHLECSRTGERLPADTLHNLSPAGAPLLARYDLDGVRSAMTREALAARAPNFWRYRELLPIRDAAHIASLGEEITPLIPLRNACDGDVLVKDEGRLPTGSFKARGLAVAVAMAKSFGVTRVALPTNGNAGAAAAAYASRLGIECFVFCPDDTPELNIRETELAGGKVWRVNGLINDCGRVVAEGEGPMGWFNLSTLKEPYRIEGKKTMGIELAEQLGWALPDVIFYPTGGGTGLIGMWKAFDELEAIGLIGPERPRMIAVQATGCAPIVKAFEDGAEHAPLWEDAHTVAAGMRVPVAIGDFLILRAVRDSGGYAVAVEDAAILEARERIGKADGLLLCPEGAATAAAYFDSRERGLVSAGERAVLFNCGNGLKYPMPTDGRSLDLAKPIDWEPIARA